MTVQDIENNTSNKWKITISAEEKSIIRRNPLYKGRLSYIKDIILEDNSDIDPGNISERLDIPISIAILLLEDCMKKE